MKKLAIPMLAALVGTGLAAQRSVLVEEFSTWTCPYCPYAIRAVDSLKKTMGDTVTVLCHIYGTSGDANVRFNFYDIYYVPTDWIDGIIADTGGSNATYGILKGMVDSRKTIPSPLRIENVNAYLQNGAGHVECDVVLEDNIPSTDNPKVFAAITERGIQANQDGTKSYHYFRDMISNVQGDALSVFGSGEQQHFAWDFTISSWNPDSLDVAIWVQYTNYGGNPNTNTEALQSYQTHIVNMGVAEGVAYTRLSLGLRGNALRFGLPDRGPVSLRLYDVSGRQVAVLASGTYSQGEHEVSLPALGHGVYTAVLSTRFGTETEKFVK